jgi:hypothetical protein
MKNSTFTKMLFGALLLLAIVTASSFLYADTSSDLQILAEFEANTPVFSENVDGTYSSTNNTVVQIPEMYVVDIKSKLKEILEKLRQKISRKKSGCIGLRKDIEKQKAIIAEKMKGLEEKAKELQALKAEFEKKAKEQRRLAIIAEQLRLNSPDPMAIRKAIELANKAASEMYKVKDKMDALNRELETEKARRGIGALENELKRLQTLYNDLNCDETIDDGASLDELSEEELASLSDEELNDWTEVESPILVAPLTDAEIETIIAPGIEESIISEYETMYVTQPDQLEPLAVQDQDYSITMEDVVEILGIDPTLEGEQNSESDPEITGNELPPTVNPTNYPY